jgi:hypothetical protein
MQEFAGGPKPSIGNRRTPLGPDQNRKTPSFDGMKGIFVSPVVPKICSCNISAGLGQNRADSISFVLSRGTKLQSTIKRQHFQAVLLDQGHTNTANFCFGGTLLGGRQPPPMYGNGSRLCLDAFTEPVGNECATCALQGDPVVNLGRVDFVPAVGK